MLNDLEYLAKSIKWYETRGFQYIDTPWTVSDGAILATIPINYAVKSDFGNMVGSSEQGFIELDLAGKLPLGRYISYSPCYRFENEDDIHQRSFMKTEIYITDHINQQSLDNLCYKALKFFENIAKLDGEHTVAKVATVDGFDIEVNGIEVGSYGIRNYKHLNWIYGTGCAVPRLSVALSKGLTK